MSAPTRPVDDVRAWKPRVAGIREVLHARFVEHAYPLHTHDDWTLFIVDDGAIRYDLDGRDHGARPSTVGFLPPHVAHDGRPGVDGGYRKRVLYVDTSVLPESLIGAAVDRPGVTDPALHARLSALHDALARPDDALEAETRFAFVAERVRALLGRPDAQAPSSTTRALAGALRDYLDARIFEPVTLDQAARDLGWSGAHLARSFTSTFGLAPHAYVLGRRLDSARDRILAGQPLADVASEVGFFDQAHLTHRFRRFIGTTPQRFARGPASIGARA
jgi:AraC-like DNA-binding protein